MLVRQISIERHPLLAALYKLLLAAPRPEPRSPIEANCTWDEFNKHLNAKDLNPDFQICRWRICREIPEIEYEAQRLLQLDFPSFSDAIELRSAFYYPAQGGQSWHTNANSPGGRVYIVRSTSDKSGIGTLEKFYPDVPESANVFDVGGDTWHYVTAPTERWSLGLRLKREDVLGI